jgi:ribosomal protein S18 acetylase RimI-like enzyme
MMMEIEYKDEIEGKYYEIINDEFEKFAIKNGVKCDYKPFIFIAREDDNVLGFITGHSYYKEVYISDLIIYEEHRKKHIGSKLVKEVEEFFKDKGFNNINLTTYDFQAPEFYKKCGFTVEFVRENKENPKLNKYYLAKYF